MKKETTRQLGVIGLLTILFITCGLSFGTAHAYQLNRDCEIQYRTCTRDAERNNPGKDPCSQYSRCQQAKQCEAARCVCNRTGGSADPALGQEAALMCTMLMSPNGPNACDQYIDACKAWVDSQYQNTTPPTPATPQPGMPSQPLPPHTQPRFR